MSILWFVGIAAVGVLCLTLVGLSRLNWWLRGLLTIAVCCVVGLFAKRVGTPTTLGDERLTFVELANLSPIRECLLFVIMLLGMMARMLSLAIEERRTRVKALELDEEKEKLRIDRWEFVYPMLFAVPTFGAIISQLQSEKLSIVATTLAFQNGFFWQTIIKRNVDGG
jgi:TctA family transporter